MNQHYRPSQQNYYAEPEQMDDDDLQESPGYMNIRHPGIPMPNSRKEPLNINS